MNYPNGKKAASKRTYTKKRNARSGIKVSYDGFNFDSKAERDYYIVLKNNPTIKQIILQPKYTLLEPFKLRCKTCLGSGKGISLKTGKNVTCAKCRGLGHKVRQGWTYTADFKVIYEDDTEEVIDVKGYPNERFSLTKKMFEYVYKRELVVVKKQKDGSFKRS